MKTAIPSFLLIVCLGSPSAAVTGLALDHAHRESVPGPFGILQLPARYESHRATFRQQISQSSETVVAQMEGSGSLRHFWLTISGIKAKPEHGLYLTLRIYFDGRSQPNVEMPVTPFFGMHHAHEARTLNSPYLQVTDRAGFNSYFPMPYDAGMRMTLQNDGPADLTVWFQADYHRYEADTLHEPLRFHAVYRRVNPNEAYGRPYHLAHAVGRGVIIGTTMGWRVFDRSDAWFHCGGDLVLLDGQISRARVLSGIGGEDFFGTAWGQDVFANGKYDRIPESGLSWRLCGPFSCKNRTEFMRPDFPEKGINFEESTRADFGQYARAVEQGRAEPTLSRWHPQVRPVFHFVDLTPFFRPRLRTNGGFPVDVSAYASTTIESAEARKVRIRVGHDDWLRLWLNGTIVYDGERLHGFKTRELDLELDEGKNSILVKVANHDNTNFRAWVFLLDVLDP